MNKNCLKTIAGALLLAGSLLTGCASYESNRVEKDRWTKGDTVRQAVFTGLELIDCNQTHKIIDNNIYENNRWLNDLSDRGRVNYFASCIVLNSLISYLLPRDFRNGWQYGSIGYEYEAIDDNYGNLRRIK